jgi:transposase-like protein
LMDKYYILYLFNLNRGITMNCPRCGAESEKTGKEWKFGLFDAEQYYCKKCEKSFSAYYRDGKFSYTVPKAK